MWHQVNRAMHGINVNNILRLIDLILDIPLTSVKNERAFSQLKLIKTVYRNRRTKCRLNHILIIKLNGTGILELLPDNTIDSWMVLCWNKICAICKHTFYEFVIFRTVWLIIICDKLNKMLLLQWLLFYNHNKTYLKCNMAQHPLGWTDDSCK